MGAAADFCRLSNISTMGGSNGVRLTVTGMAMMTLLGGSVNFILVIEQKETLLLERGFKIYILLATGMREGSDMQA